MPEGLDQARDAFQQAISPQATQPRDTGGRFAPAARPESMFEPRPVEGDEKTGDTRDAGDDPRLSAMERRIADGRAEEGDEEFHRVKSLPDKPARAGPAAGDGGHGEQEAEQAGSDDQPEQSDQDAEGEDKRADGEGEPEPDAEAGPKYEVTVDGQTTEVSLPEALKGYIREETFRKRMTQVDLARQTIEQEAGNIGQARDVYAQKLQYLDTLLAHMTPQEPNWDQEFAADPREAHNKQKAYAEIYQKRHWIDSELQRTQHETQAQYDERSKNYAINQFTEFVREANIPDEKALNETLTLMRAYGRKEGFSEGELAQTYDKRMLRVLRKAALYDQGQANKPKAVVPGKGKTLIPGVATPVGNATRRHIDEAQQRLAKTGRMDDAAAVMARLIR
jgi:hypothetical protein